MNLCQKVNKGQDMEIKKENGKVITKMSFSECFFGYDDPEISKLIINRFDEILCYPNQPERLNPEDVNESPTYDSLQDLVNKNPHMIFGASLSVCDSPNSENK